MKRAFRVVTVFAAILFKPTASQAFNPSSLSDLGNLRANVKTVQAIHTHIEVYGRRVAVTATFEYGAPNINACSVMEVDAGANTFTIAIHQQQVQKFSQLNLTAPVCDPAAGVAKDQSKFTYSDPGRVRRIDWYDQRSGFLMESAKFDDTGNVMVFDRYTQVIIGSQPVASYACGWHRPRRSGLDVEHQKASPDIQVNEMEVYCDLETAYNLRMGLGQDLASHHISLSPLPTSAPTAMPTAAALPTLIPTAVPIIVAPAPTSIAAPMPTAAPTLAPTTIPTIQATQIPTALPTPAPTLAPTNAPTAKPTIEPTIAATAMPTLVPTPVPTIAPTAMPTAIPTAAPKIVPTAAPTSLSTAVPTVSPLTAIPTAGGRP